jgi:hypothetical protein
VDFPPAAVETLKFLGCGKRLKRKLEAAIFVRLDGHDRNRHSDLGFAESQAAAIKHTVIRVEKTIGVVKAYLQHKPVIATKQTASAHGMLRTCAKVSAGSPPSSHANTAENKRNTQKKSPNALKKSQ